MSEHQDKPDNGGAGELYFSSLYTPEQARRYFFKHQESLGRRLSHWKEVRMARRALRLAGDPASVLDLPCGAGRFWRLLAERADRELLAADYSAGMLQVARQYQPRELLERFRLVQTSAFRIALEEGAVENIFCMRLMHHIGERVDRLRLLREFHRVARDSVCLSLWVDDNWQGRRRRRVERERALGIREYKRGYQDRFVQSPREVEEEFAEAGFEVAGKVDLLPGWSIWRTYVLKKRR